MKIHVFRLTNGADLKKEIINFTTDNGIKAGCVVTCVGHLSRATIRMPDGNSIRDFEGGLEITSLSGTLGNKDAHLHISFGDQEGKGYGGHMKYGCLVGVTAEVVIAEFEEYSFLRKLDAKTGCEELLVKHSAED